MLNRRELLAQGTTILLLVPFISSCSSNNNSSADAAGGACAGIDSTSSLDAAGTHTHEICVLTTDLTSPPAAGVTYTSTNVGSHTHTLMLTAAQLTSIQSGMSVGPITSSSDVDPINGLAHTHTWTIMKM